MNSNYNNYRPTKLTSFCSWSLDDKICRTKLSLAYEVSKKYHMKLLKGLMSRAKIVTSWKLLKGIVKMIKLSTILS